MPNEITPHDVCDGGDLDCGSGLLLIIKRHMDPLATGQILEVMSREASVADDLPAWCRMTKHTFLGSTPREDTTSYFIQKGGASASSKEDQQAAKGYNWSVRAQGDDGLTAKVFARNHTIYAGQPADFSVQVDAPSATDYLLASLASCLIVGFKANASRMNLTVDAVECSLKGQLDNALYHLGLEDTGSPAFAKIHGAFYVSSPDDEEDLETCWDVTRDRSPIYQTLQPNVTIDIPFSIIL